MSAAASLIRSKKPYRSRYCSSDQSEGPPAVQPGQNVLNAIKTYFDKTDNVEENALGLFNSISPGSETSSRLSLPVGLQGSMVAQKPNVLTSSGRHIEKALGQKTPLPQTPRSAASSSIKKLKRTLHKQDFNCTSDSDEEEDPTTGSGPILLAPPEASVDKQAHGFRELYRTHGSAHRGPASSFAKVSAIKRHSPIVTGYQRAVQQKEEFLVNPEEDNVLNPWVGTVQTIDQRRTPIAKNAIATGEVKSIPDIIQSKSSSRLPSSVPSHAKNVDVMLLENQKDSLLKCANKKSVSTDSSHTFQMKAKDKFTLSTSDLKGLTRGHFNQGTLGKKDAPHTFSRGSEKKYAYSVKRDVGKNLKHLASPHVISDPQTPYSSTKDTSKQFDSLYLTRSPKKPQNHIRQEQLGNNRRQQLRSVLDYLSRKKVQIAKDSYYSEDQKEAKSKQSLFLQAATVGHPNKRCPPGSDLPAAASTQQTLEDDFSVHEDLNVSSSFITIPKTRKQRRRQQSKSAFKESEVDSSTKHFPHCKRGTQIRDNCGKNDEEALSKLNITYVVDEDGNPTFDLDNHSPLQTGSGNVSSSNIDNSARKDHVHAEHIVLWGENADERTISDREYISQKKQTNLHSRKKYKVKNRGGRCKLVQERDIKMTLSKPQLPSVLPNEDSNENLYNGDKENKKKTVRKRVQKKVSSNNVPVNALRNENSETNQMVNKNANCMEPTLNVIEGNKKTVRKRVQKNVSLNDVAVDVLRNENSESNLMVNKNADSFEPALDIIEGKKTVRKKGQKKVSSNDVAVVVLRNENSETNQMVNENADSFEPALNVIEGLGKKKTARKRGQKKVSSNTVPVDVLQNENSETSQMVNKNTDRFEPALDVVEGNKTVRKRGQIKGSSNDVPVDVLGNENSEIILMVNENADSFEPALNIIEETNIPKRVKTASTVKENSSRCSRRQRKAPGDWWVVKSPVPLNGISFLQNNIHGHPANDLPSASNLSKENLGQSGIRKDNKQSAELNIFLGGTSTVAPESVAEPLECSPPKTSLGKRKKSMKDDQNDVHSKPKKMPKSIKAKSKSKIPKANNKKMLVDAGEPKMVDPNKGSRISVLQKSFVPGEPKTPANLSSLVTVGAVYEKSPCANKAVQNMLGNNDTDRSTSTKTPANSAKMVTPVKTAGRFKHLVQGDCVTDVVDGPESPFNVESGKNQGLKRNPELFASYCSAENAGATRPEENQITCDPSEPLVMPSNTPKLRHSTRTRLRPMQYWRGERVDYLPTPSGGFVINGIISPEDKECRRKPAAKVKDSHKRKTGKVGKRPCKSKMKQSIQSGDKIGNLGELSYEHVNMVPIGPTVVLDAATGKQIETECVKISHHCAVTLPKEKISVCKTLSTSGFSTGKLKIGPLQEKGYQFVCNNTMVFYIISGAVELLLHETIYHLKTGDYFFVPPGNMYNITNLLEMEAECLFCQIKGPPMSVVEEDK